MKINRHKLGFINNLLIIIVTRICYTVTQNVNIELKQGTIIGLKIYPEASRTAVYSYIGIPYAQPPIGKLRFLPPVPHLGWNRTLYAREFKPMCPQIDNNIYEEIQTNYSPYQLKTDEDCLYLNIWTPQIDNRSPSSLSSSSSASPAGMPMTTNEESERINSKNNIDKLPVLIVISGEEMTFDWIKNRLNGLDLAAEGLVVVTVQYRMNIFGWLTLEVNEVPGNLGLRDQLLAFKWIEENIHKFGGNSKYLTLMGHGTSGASLAMLHLINPNIRNVFSKAILMSGTIFSPQTFQIYRNNQNPSMKIVRNLVCDSINSRFSLECLQQKSISDLLKAFENVYKNGNYTTMLGPQIDNYAQRENQLVSDDPRKLISTRNFPNIPIIIGICNNEGAFMQDKWLHLARDGYPTLYNFINTTIIPNILELYDFKGPGRQDVIDMINWKFFGQSKPKNVPQLLHSLQRLLSESKYENYFYETIQVFLRDNIKHIKSTVITTINNSDQMLFNNNNNNNNQDNRRDNGFYNSNNIVTPNSQEQNAQIYNVNNNFNSNNNNNNNNNNKQRQLQSIGESTTTIIDNIENYQPLYVYSFQHSTSMDLRGKINLFGGASHSSELPLLFGPSLFQQIGRRRLTHSEDKLCKQIRRYFCDFIKFGNPTPGRLFDAWKPYTKSQKYIQIIGDSGKGTGGDGSSTGGSMNEDESSSILLQNKIQIEQLLQSQQQQQHTNQMRNPYNIGSQNFEDRSNAQNNYRNAKNYIPNDLIKDSEYYQELNGVYAFWNNLLPKIYGNKNKLELSLINETNRLSREEEILSSLDQQSVTYKHAFFSMLALVCLLLAFSGICIYLLKKSTGTLNPSTIL